MNSNPPKKFPATPQTNPKTSNSKTRSATVPTNLYEARGRAEGHELEDWFRAKEEIAIKKFRTASA